MINVDFATAYSNNVYRVIDTSTGVDSTFISRQVRIQGQTGVFVFDSGAVPLGNAPIITEIPVTAAWGSSLAVASCVVQIDYYDAVNNYQKTHTYLLPLGVNIQVN